LQTQSVIQGPERAFLVGAELGRNGAWDVESSLEELSQLADTAGAKVIGKLIAKIAKPNPATFIGSGKTESLAQLCKDENVEVVIFDDDLNPVQLRNLQKVCGARIIDRTQLILDIFSRRARTKESQLQVELAQLQYLLPRLTRQWLHLSRQVGGIGTRGPGETQLEVDRRRVKTRIMKLTQELREITTERSIQRKKRERKDLSVVSIIGYTNAGKTTLFNRLTLSANLVEDQLFATLDSTIRKVHIEGFMNVLFSDTVGFIRKLPHHLVESFKTTLEEVTRSDLLIHVIDAGDHLVEEKYDVVLGVLSELNAQEIPHILALNKIDLLESPDPLRRWMNRKEHHVVPISAKNGQGIDQLIHQVVKSLQERYQKLKVFIPHSKGDLTALLYREAHILEKVFDEKGVFLEVEVPKHLLPKIIPYQMND
jgi:GTP-binding protein HflX